MSGQDDLLLPGILSELFDETLQQARVQAKFGLLDERNPGCVGILGEQEQGQHIESSIGGRVGFKIKGLASGLAAKPQHSLTYTVAVAKRLDSDALNSWQQVLNSSLDGFKGGLYSGLELSESRAAARFCPLGSNSKSGSQAARIVVALSRRHTKCDKS